MNWQGFWDEKGKSGSSPSQVARIVNGIAMDDLLLQKIADKISVQLELKKEDSLLDVCCGNGALTRNLINNCRQISAIDFSEILINRAKEFGSNRIEFVCANATDFELNQKFDKVLLYFSFQYFERYQDGKMVIANLIKHAKPGALILIGDITDSRKFFSYYNSLPKIGQWLKQRLLKKNDMGKFWHPNELFQICKELGVDGQVIEQESWQPYAHYRFDFLIKR